MDRDQLLADIATFEGGDTISGPRYEALCRILPILRTLAELSDEQRAYLVSRAIMLRRAPHRQGVKADAWCIAAKLFSGEP